jgi:DNA-binding PadR family transcriptional regulator
VTSTRIQKYHVLGAMLALWEFTVDDLRHLTGVKPPTIYSVLRRNQAYTELIGEEESRARGGRRQRYRMVAERAEELQILLRDAFQFLSVAETIDVDPQIALSALASAEDTLDRMWPLAENDADRHKVIALAWTELETARIPAVAHGLTPEQRQEIEDRSMALTQRARQLAQQLGSEIIWEQREITPSPGMMGQLRSKVRNLYESMFGSGVLERRRAGRPWQPASPTFSYGAAPAPVLYLYNSVSKVTEKTTTLIKNIEKHSSAIVRVDPNDPRSWDVSVDEALSPKFCVMLINSKQETKMEQHLEFMKSHVGEWAIIVLDEARNPAARNVILAQGGSAQYIDDAGKLDDPALGNLLNPVVAPAMSVFGNASVVSSPIEGTEISLRISPSPAKSEQALQRRNDTRRV